MSKNSNGWTSISITNEMVEDIDKFLEERGRKLGYTSRPDVVMRAVRRFLDEIKE